MINKYLVKRKNKVGIMNYIIQFFDHIRTRKFNLTPYLFLLIPGIFYIIFFLYPLIDNFLLSFTDFKGLGDQNFIGFANYQALIQDNAFITALKNTFFYSIIVVIVLIIIPFFVALLLNSKIFGINIFRALYYVPVITSMIIAGLSWKLLFHSEGLVNSLLKLAGLISGSIGWLSNPKLALYSVMWLTIWKASPWYAVIYLAGLQSIPTDLYEAALIDGANRGQLIRFITVPLIRPYTTVVGVVATIGALKVFGEVYVLTGGGPLQATYVLNYYIYNLAFRFWRMGYASSVGVILLLIVLIASLLNLRILEQRELYE
jgi:putative chitobiose transport system permease protein